MNNEDQKLNEVLDQCLDRMFRGESVEKCLQDHPELAAELEPLLRTALAARKTSSTIQPRAEFKARARYEFMAELHDRAEQKKKFRFSIQWRWQSVWAIALTAMVIVVLSASGTVLAASNSMPDDTLYPVKLATEQAQVAMTRSDVAKAELHAKLADKRVEEIVYVAGKGDPQKVEAASKRLDDQLAKIATLTKNPESKPEPGRTPLATPSPSATSRATVDHPTNSNPVVTPAPPPAPALSARPTPKPPPSVAAAATSRPDASSRNNNSDRSLSKAEREKLKEVVTRNAANHSAQLNNALNKAPSSVKPAMKKAITDAENAYRQAIKNMNEDDQDDR
jgi:hypothetical protein